MTLWVGSSDPKIVPEMIHNMSGGIYAIFRYRTITRLMQTFLYTCVKLNIYWLFIIR